jgi:regulator of sirC expression with transglutaminase-like and TPR domain
MVQAPPHKNNPGGALLSRPLATFIVCGLFLVSTAHSAQSPSSRTWHFDLTTPGTYEVHVQHQVKGSFVPRGAEAIYMFRTNEKTVKRNLAFYPQDNVHPVVVLIADITTSQQVSVVISGIPSPLLQQTRVYVIAADSRYPYEWYDPDKSVNLKAASRIRDILRQPEQQIDIARAKLSTDKLIDPAIDVEANLRKIDTMATQIKSLPGFGLSQTDSLLTLKRYLYESGTWNNFQPYQYDLADPLGTNLRNKLLPHYLTTKKGNCVTMPFLFLILGQRLGLNVSAATAPLHILVKFKDETGTTYNLETTSGGNPARNAWYREQMPMTDEAITNGAYLRPLTKKETVALMAETLAEHYFERQEFEQTIVIANLALEYHPQYVEAMILKGSAYYRLMDKYYFSKYRSPDQIPERARGYFAYLSRNNRLWFAKAEALGWRQPSKAEEEKYLQSVKEAKSQTVN